MVQRTMTVAAILAAGLALAACGDEDEGEDAKPEASLKRCPLTFADVENQDGESRCELEPGCTQAGSLWGSNPYLGSMSGPCTAAVHSGLLEDEPIVAKIEFFEAEEARELEGGEANGVNSSAYAAKAGEKLVRISVAE